MLRGKKRPCRRGELLCLGVNWVITLWTQFDHNIQHQPNYHPNAGIVAAASMGLGCGWIATRAVAASSVVESHPHLEHQWHQHQQHLEYHCHQLALGIKSSSSSHLYLKQANGGGALLHVTNRFQCFCGFFAFVSVCFFYSRHHGRFSLAYCANCVFLLFLGAKIMASPKT